MISRDEAYDIIQDLNESAHQQSWDTWEEADRLSDSDDEADWDEAEDLKTQASAEQAQYFREGFNELDEHIKTSVLHYVDTDEDFRAEFVIWYGEDDYNEDFN